MPSFGEVLTSIVRQDDAYRLDTPDDWAQGRTLFGGMTAALSLAAARDALGELGPLRSAQLAFVGPAAGALRLRPELLRQGRSSAMANVDCFGENGLAARATFVFGAARDSEVTHVRVATPDVPPPDECAPFHRTSKPLAGFLGRFEFRLAAGARLLETEKPPEFSVWVRYRDAIGNDPLAALLAMGDALPSAAWVSFPKPAAVSTMTWTMDFHRQPEAADDWHLIHSTSESAGEGYSLQAMRVYSRAGEPIASARQLVAIFI